MCAAAWGSSAGAAPVTFEVTAGEAVREATVESATRDGVAYVPLSRLVGQLGGQAQVTSTRITVDYGKNAALVEAGQDLVNASLGEFRLSKPVLESGGEAWIAVDDVVPFFRQAFNVEPALRQAPAQPLPEEQALLERFPDPPAADATAVADPADPIVVVIDPGHGGADAGASGSTLAEKAFTLALAQRVAKALEQAPRVKVVLTRTDDADVPVLDRVNRAIRENGKAFVSLHGGAALADTTSGVEIFCATDKGVHQNDPADGPGALSMSERFRYARAGRDLAEAVHSALAGAEGVTLRGLHPVRSAWMQRLPMPVVLVEAGYLTNPNEETLLADEAHQDRLAQGIAAGVLHGLGLAAVTGPPATAEAPAEGAAP